jgi:hypothetical protein
MLEDAGGQLAGSQDVQPGQALSCSSGKLAVEFPDRRPFVEQLGFRQVPKPGLLAGRGRKGWDSGIPP